MKREKERKGYRRDESESLVNSEKGGQWEKKNGEQKERRMGRMKLISRNL